MEHEPGVNQRDLRRIRCQWGAYTQRYAILVPFFRRDYRVFGIMGVSLGSVPVWYPGVPVNVGRGRLVYKNLLGERPPPLTALEPELFQGAYYHDPWHVVGGMMAMLPGVPDLEQATNLAGRSLRGRPLLDVVYEPPLHRVRAFQVRRGWLGSERWSVLGMPAIVEALDPLPRGRQVSAGPAGLGAPRRSRLQRALRDMLEPEQEPGLEKPPPEEQEEAQEEAGAREEESAWPGRGRPAQRAGARKAPPREEGFLARMVRRAIEAGMEDQQR